MSSPAVVQSAFKAILSSVMGIGPTNEVTLTNPTSAGNCIIVFATVYNSATGIAGISDGTNTYTQFGSTVEYVAETQYISIWIADDAASVSTIGLNCASALLLCDIFVVECSDIKTSSPGDINYNVHTNGDAPVTVGPTSSTAQASELALLFQVTSRSAMTISGWTQQQYATDINLGNYQNVFYQVLSSTGTVSATLSYSSFGDQQSFIVTLEAAPPPPAATPVASPVAGFYVGTQSVTLSCSTPGSSIFFTVNGTTPTSGSTPYTGPVSIASSQTLKAIATASGFSNSAVLTAIYVINGLPYKLGNLLLTPEATDLFTPNTNPLNSAYWTTMTDTFFGTARANGGKFESTTTTFNNGLIAGAFYTAASFPANQYVAIKVAAWGLGSSNESDAFLRSPDLSGDFGYDFSITDQGDGVTADITFGYYDNTENYVSLFDNEAGIVTVGDEFVFAIVGSTLYLYQNGVLVTPPTPDPDNYYPNAGYIGIDVDPQDSAGETQWSNFEAGSVILETPAGDGGGFGAGGSGKPGPFDFGFGF